MEEVRARLGSDLIIPVYLLDASIRLVDSCYVCGEVNCITINQFVDGRLEFMCKTCNVSWPWDYQEVVWGIRKPDDAPKTEPVAPTCSVKKRKKGG
ncbi:MAG: hypothetical protein AMS21_01175 [Gemmatimonas sp. SG8_38_2]|nr:MAG: hypothetical protein AMS21_01175 [Gemmatimonas sp. SG8_38_2]